MSKYMAKKKVIDCIRFDSVVESKYFEKLKRDVTDNKICMFSLQPIYKLQPKFIQDGIKYREINYKADFKVYNIDGTIDVIDIKGLPTPEAKMKRKMYNYIFKDTVKWICWYGKAWRDYDDVQKIKKERKKARLSKLILKI